MAYDDEVGGSTPYLPDWEREKQGRSLMRDAYTRPVMALFNASNDARKRTIMNKMKDMGVQDGLNKNALPETRKAFMLWAEEKWPDECAALPEWPKPSLAAKFEAAAFDYALRGGTNGHPTPPVTPARPVPLEADRSVFGKGPNVGLVLTCYCGKVEHLRAAPGEFRCKCGAVWNVKHLLINGRPSMAGVTFGVDPEAGGPQPIYKSVPPRPAPPERPRAEPAHNAPVRGEVFHDDEDVGLPPDFAGMGPYKVGPIGSHQREPSWAVLGDDPGDTREIAELPDGKGDAQDLGDEGGGDAVDHTVDLDDRPF